MKLNKLLTALALITPITGAFACASCGCSLNTDLSAQGMSNVPGWTFDTRYDYLNQNQLRSGTSTISAQKAAATTNPNTGSLAEVEGYTKNNYLTTSLDYNNGETWGATVILPFIDRTHMTYGIGSWPSGDSGYTSNASGLGDIKLMGRYFGFSEQKNWGLQLGIKLPTGNNGQFGVQPGSPTTAVAVDPGLQLGTGSTDLIVGTYRFGHILSSDDWGYFSNVQFQAAIDPKSTPASIDALGSGGSYRPGNGLNINAGVNYQGFEGWVPMLQFNFVDKKADTGTAADTWSTGGVLLYATPGLVHTTSSSAQLYANAQLPLYQNLNGIQLAPKFVISMGIKLHF